MTLKSCAVGMRNAIPRNHLKFRPDWSSLRPIYTMRLRRVRQDYDRLTTWLKTIYTHTTFSLAKLNTPKFVPEFTESILVVLCFEKKSFLTRCFRFNPFSTFRETTSCESVNNNFVRHFDARKLLFRPLLSRNLSKYVISINFGYDCRSVLKQQW